MQVVDASPDQVRQAEAHILPAFRKSLDEVLRDRQDPRPVPVEQNTRRALGHAEWAYVMVDGETVAEGPGPELLGRPELVDMYLGG